MRKAGRASDQGARDRLVRSVHSCVIHASATYILIFPLLQGIVRVTSRDWVTILCLFSRCGFRNDRGVML